jgi:hypothetical protein
MEYLGIDFSGNALSWRDKCSTSNVWICRLLDDGNTRPRITELCPVQQLAGTGSPFRRLADLLAGGRFAAASIDAPFSLPQRHVTSEGWLALLRMVDALECSPRAPFPSGQSLIKLAAKISDLERPKPLRLTEKYWFNQGVNVRSTLWWKPRGGAPFAAACMKLLATAGFPPCWPWSSASEGLIAEAFPAAQLRCWDLPCRQYSGPEGTEHRQQIIRGLEHRINFNSFEALAERSADALDAVIASFGAIAAHQNKAIPPAGDPVTLSLEGWIAVHPNSPIV